MILLKKVNNIFWEGKMASFGNRLKELREERGLSLKQLSERIQVSDAAICKWENDISEPKLTYIIRLAQYFGITLDELTGQDDLVPFTEQTQSAFHLSPEERKLVEDYRGLAKPLKELLQDMIRSWQENTRKENFRKES